MGWLRQFSGHIHAHPYRLLVTLVCLVVVAWVAAGVSLVHSQRVERGARLENCMSVVQLNHNLQQAWLAAERPDIARFFDDDREC